MLEKKGISILIVDDDRITRFIHERVLQLSLSDYEVEISEAENGAEAFHLLKTKIRASEKLPDLILLDVNMPYMNGFEFVDALMQLQPADKPEVIIITSSENLSDKRVAESMGIKYFFSKPARADALRAAIMDLRSH
jgi:CheY-like chemotaxis protein